MEKRYSFEDLKEIVRMLRSENGCPWDREQTMESLKAYVLEESYEVMDAIPQGGLKLADELGDLLLQIVMLAQIGEEQGSFTLQDVTDAVCRKMIHRHPHVFGDASAENSEQVLQNWEVIKRQERGISSHTGALEDVTKNLPALLYACKIQKKAAKIGFDFDTVDAMLEKVEEELGELRQEIARQNTPEIEKEMGDVFFAAVNVARFLKVNPELALTGSTKKFITRFARMETLAEDKGQDLAQLSFSEMDLLWDQAKREEA